MLIIELLVVGLLTFLAGRDFLPDFDVQAIEGSDKPPQAIVILVHGTFAVDAPWMQEGSTLRNAVKSRFQNIAVRFYEFNWAGSGIAQYNNTNIARHNAGIRLAKVLRDLITTFPAAQIFIVAHSHGGNVALYAVDELPGVKLGGVVTMGTPFLEITPTPIKADVTLIESARIVASACWLALIIGSQIAGFAGMILGGILINRSGVAVKVAGGIVIFLSLGVSMWAFRPDGVETVEVPASPTSPAHTEYRTKFVLTEEAEQLRRDWADKFVKYVLNFGERKQNSLSMKLTAWAVPSVPVLCMQTTDYDEAMIALGRVEPALESVERLISDPKLALGVTGSLFALCGLAGVAFGAWMLMAALREAKERHDLSLGRVTGAVFGGVLVSWWVAATLSAALMLALAVLAPLSIIARAPAAIPALIFYGSTDVLAEYFVHTKALRSPKALNGNDEATCTPRFYDFDGNAGLRHSQYYVNPKALKEMSEYLRYRYDNR